MRRYNVEEEGIAWKCGIRSGDRIVEIDGNDAGTMTLPAIGTYFVRPMELELRVQAGIGNHAAQKSDCRKRQELSQRQAVSRQPLW